MSNIVDHPLSVMRKELEAIKRQVIKLQDEARQLRADHFQAVKANLMLEEKIERLEQMLLRSIAIASRPEAPALPAPRKKPRPPSE
jgi:septation ring formation regulator EzrA